MRTAHPVLVLIALALFAATTACRAADNILLIIADDYGADSSALYNSTTNGASLPPTPTITALAQRGVLFRNAYANPVCSPTRACLLTGRHSFRTGIGDAVAGAGSPTLLAAEHTLPDAFAANASLGYQLAAFGKWHLALGPASPNTIGGWPHFAGNIQGAIASYTNWSKTVNGSTTAGYTNYATSDIVTDAIAWIQSQGTNAWFAWVAFNAPHTPLHKPPTDLHSYDSLLGTQADINANPRPYFEAMVEAMDTEIGRLLASINTNTTQIIFLGDNGTSPQVLQPPYPDGRGKSTLYEGGVKVPLLIAGPAVAKPGRTNATPVHAVDLFRTILDLAGAATATTNTIDSQSLLPILQDHPDTSRDVYAELFGTNILNNADGRALRNAQFKLIKFNNGDEEFYDLLADPYEGTNLLTNTLTAPQQAHYNSLTLKLGDYQDTLAAPAITSLAPADSQFAITVERIAGLTYSLWRAATPDTLAWSPVTNALITLDIATVTLTDTNAAGSQQFYRIGAQSP